MELLLVLPCVRLTTRKGRGNIRPDPFGLSAERGFSRLRRNYKKKRKSAKQVTVGAHLSKALGTGHVLRCLKLLVRVCRTPFIRGGIVGIPAQVDDSTPLRTPETIETSEPLSIGTGTEPRDGTRRNAEREQTPSAGRRCGCDTAGTAQQKHRAMQRFS